MTQSLNTPTTYKDAGVSVDAGNELVDNIKPIVKQTARPGSSPDIGGFGGLFDLAQTGYKDPILVAATDGVGTKLKIATAMNKHNTIGIDLVAMCVNDLVVQGAEPLFFLDYFATGKLDKAQAQDIITGIADGCKQAGCALIGGETAEMPGMYAAGDYDVAGFSVGAVERDAVLPADNIQAGDILIGLPSSGVHSNGFSLVRHITERAGLSYQDAVDGIDGTLGDALLTPTRIYIKSCLPLIKSGWVKALSHITGGGLTENLPRIFPDTLAASIDLSSWELSALFQWIKQTGNIETSEMLRTFNCGIGMVLIVAAENKAPLCQQLDQQGETYHIIGELTDRSGEAVTFTQTERWDG